MEAVVKKDWEVRTAEVSKSTGGLSISGVNHCAAEEINRSFCWTVGYHSFRDESRFDFSGCKFGPGAEEKLAALRKLASCG